MFPLASASARLVFVSICSVVLMWSAASGTLAITKPSNVAIVANLQSPLSGEIARYYANARRIPLSNIVWLNCSTSEIVTLAECENNILAPIKAFLEKPAMSGKIDYIVLTKGVPLGANYGYSTGALSITSILTCIHEPSITGYIENPYGPLSWEPTEVAFSHQLELCGYHLYLVTRLDGYTREDILAMIDRSVAPSPLGPVALDQRYLGTNPTGPNKMLNDRLLWANNVLTAKGIPTIFDSTDIFLGNMSGLMGYFSHGSNDQSYTLEAYRSNTFVPGSIADTFVSSSARTFSVTSTGQSLIADLISQGACGLSGFVSEPYTAFATYPEVFWDRYTKGFNMAESFYAATPMLFWKSTVVGDPLMAPYATVPNVQLQFPSPPLTGVAQICATATDPEGIAKVEFFFDDELIGTCTNAPYAVCVDTTLYAVGKHKVEALATDAGVVSTKGSASATVDVVNEISVLHNISESFANLDGQLVRTYPKVVTAGTMELGGDEFYVGEYDRSAGIKVVAPMVVQEGDVVTLTGSLSTWEGERAIIADDVQVLKTRGTAPRPLGIPNVFVGGGNICPETRGVTGGIGPRNIGLLIQVWGKTTYIGGDGEDFFYIDDGSRLRQIAGRAGIKARCNGLAKPPLGVNVVVTGISSCEELGSKTIPLVKIRRQSDIRLVN